MTTSQSEEEDQTAAVELELFIRHQIEQDRHDLKLFYEMKNEEADIEKARRFYTA